MSSVKGKTAIFRRGDPDAPNKLAVGCCTLGLLRVETMVMFMATGMPLGQAQGFVFAVGYGIQDARNIAWNIAEGQGYEYFMFWDDDIVPLAFGAVETLLETMEQNPEIDILGGVYPARQGIPAPIVVQGKDEAPWWGWEDGGIHPVYLTGTGFTMYRMESFKKLNSPVMTKNTVKGAWNIKQHFNLENGTDDYALADVAAKAGLRWYVHGGVVAHQVEPNGELVEVSKARNRIAKGDDHDANGEDQDSQGSNGSRPANLRSRKGRRPANVSGG